MKKTILIIILFTLSAFVSFNVNDKSPLKRNHNVNSSNSSAAVDFKKMDANAISTWYRTNGSFNRDLSTGNAGFEWPKGSARR